MISKFYGVPASKKRGYEQFEQLKKTEREGHLGVLNKNKFLVLKKVPSGMYKGLHANYIYSHKPKTGYKKLFKF